MNNAEILRALTEAKVEFQIRTLALLLGVPRDSDAMLGTKPEGLSPEGVAARAGRHRPSSTAQPIVIPPIEEVAKP